MASAGELEIIEGTAEAAGFGERRRNSEADSHSVHIPMISLCGCHVFGATCYIKED